ncbi:pyridoxamine 5'-phosphate oxidase family protein [Sphingomonas corticis]|uniref:Pyridoxamine 5'-phosphate oxidase family protein n=1 Tax=Sphingomonas corticis TaxID=2722791 RepID=A0ABX1CQR3_9SPHN|nr:pyridoxamine 5'-phosphate oxidase family protein [Sphingomonas corticis]NJR80279.1 pyridoxamine 5'-phosphate oxidase family protein [Sphingomonas corticis]
MTADPAAPTDLSRARRRPERATYDRPAIHAALDEGLMAHVAWSHDGQPFATPTAYWREGDTLFWHGSAGSRMIRSVVGNRACVTVSRIDGLVVGRTGFAHSINYTSVMAFGGVEAVPEVAGKRDAMHAFIDRIYPGRSPTLRPMTDAELAQITVVRMPIVEAALKVRSGPPATLEADDGWPVWAGVVPVRSVAGVMEPAATNDASAGEGPAPYRDGVSRALADLLRHAARQ